MRPPPTGVDSCAVTGLPGGVKRGKGRSPVSLPDATGSVDLL
eukprot:gene8623-5528_t